MKIIVLLLLRRDKTKTELWPQWLQSSIDLRRENGLSHFCGFRILPEIPNPQETQVQSAHVLVDAWGCFPAALCGLANPRGWLSQVWGTLEWFMLLSMKERRKETSYSWLRAGSPGSFAVSLWEAYLPLFTARGHWPFCLSAVVKPSYSQWWNRGGDGCISAESGWIKHKGFVFATVGTKDIFPPEVMTVTKEQSRAEAALTQPCAVIPLAYSLCPAYPGSAMHLHIVFPPCPWPLLCFLTSFAV